MCLTMRKRIDGKWCLLLNATEYVTSTVVLRVFETQHEAWEYGFKYACLKYIPFHY